MSVFLDHDRLGSAILRLTGEARFRCAVAFWGTGAARAFFPEARPPADARLICDVSMGGSNPTELRLLGAPDNANLRHLPGLHAKVYLSATGLITSSANASNNGIGFVQVANLVEAGTFHAPDSKAYKQAADWFERIWGKSRQVDAAALDLANRTWQRKAHAGIERLSRAPDPKSLLDAVVANPENFRGVGFVFSSGTATREQRDQTAEALINEDEQRGTPLLSQPKQGMLRNWNVEDMFSDWDPQDVSAWPLHFVCAHQGGHGRISYWFYKRAYVAVLPEDCGMVLAERPQGLRGQLGFRHGRETMAQADKERLQRIFGHIGENGGLLRESGERLAAFLADLNLV